MKSLTPGEEDHEDLELEYEVSKDRYWELDLEEDKDQLDCSDKPENQDVDGRLYSPSLSQRTASDHIGLLLASTYRRRLRSWYRVCEAQYGTYRSILP
jgi:hypothetical protein